MLETYVIHTTKQCNMKCLYCYEKDKISKYTWEETKEYITRLIENRTSDEFNIEFLGGEPLLAFNIIKNTVEFISKEYEFLNVNYTITTNGTILNNQILDFLNNNRNVQFGVSMDGNISANQLRLMKNGVNSHNIVLENMKKIRKNNILNYVHIVSHPYNVGYIYDSIRHLYNNDILRIAVGIVETTMDINDDFLKKYVSEMKKVSDDICSGKLQGLYISELEHLKPMDDIRTYVYDESNKIIGETYGRAGDDITSRKDYKVVKSTHSNNSKYISLARSKVYEYHQKNKQVIL